MTGELADCFTSKGEGVRFILAAVQEAAAGTAIRVYLTDGRLVPPAAAQPQLAAAANWHALARFAGRYAPQGDAVLMDIGSTTCDIVPLRDGVPQAAGQTDTTRLVAGELVYTGVERSPVCAITDRVPYRGQMCPVAQELFATALDVYLVLEDLPEQPDSTDTADGRPATIAAARARLARMICADPEECTEPDVMAIACATANAQVSKIVASAQQVMTRRETPPGTVLLSGHGEFLSRRVLGELGVSATLVSLGEKLGPAVSRCATAYALAVLMREAGMV
jgi:probable H4MPT-linked C1 transfer pathway protein